MANEIIRTEEDLQKYIHSNRNLISMFDSNNGTKEGTKVERILGCSFNDYRKHIESKFQEGMTWNNIGEWNCDHIIPISIAESAEEADILSNYQNIIPIWAKDNKQKSNKLPENYDEIAKLIGFRQEKQGKTSNISPTKQSNSEHFVVLFSADPFKKTNAEWADEMGVSPDTIIVWKNKHKDEIEIAKRNFTERLRDKVLDASSAAIDALANIIKTSKSEKNITSAANIVLSYGLSKQQTNNNIPEGSQIIIQINDKASVEKKAEGVVIEVGDKS